VANEVTIVVKATDQSGPAFDSARGHAKRLSTEGGTALGGFSDKIKGMGAAAGIAAGLIAVTLAKEALGALIDYSKKAVTAASNLNESVNAVNVVFGNSAKKIDDWGRTQATSLGLSQRAFNDLATPLGALLKNMGVQQDQLADKTINLTKRASDMASVFNTDVPTALDAITSGLKGEFDPLEQYGVHINAAMIQTEALAETHKKRAKDLTEAEKATASYNLIMKQTNTTAGDFKNTSDGLANSSRILAARQEELQAKIGEKLLPVMKKVNELKLKALEYIANTVFPAVERGAKHVADGFEKVWTWAGPKLKGALDDLKTAWEENKDKIEKLEPVLELVGKFLAGALYESIKTAIGGIKGLIEVLGFLGDAFNAAQKFVVNFTIDLITRLGQIVDAAAAAFGWIPGIGPKIKAAQAAFHKATDGILADLKAQKAAVASGINVAIKVTGLGSLYAARNAIADVVNAAGRTVVSVGLGHRATGGIAGGLVEVGEHGRELVRLPQGSMVYSAANTNQMTSGGGGVNRFELVASGRGGDALRELVQRWLNNGDLTVRAAALG